MNIAIITARGKSKRIPGKNIRPFCGRPIIEYSIEAAIGSGLFDEVMVSTDDEAIAAVARQNGANVPFLRSVEASDDFAPTAQVLVEVLERYRRMGRDFETGCCLYPTAPFVTAQKLQGAMEAFKVGNTAVLMPVVPFSYPPLRGCIIQNGLLKLRWPENESVRSQDLEPIYHDCGQFYIFSVPDFLREKTLFSQRTLPYVMDETEVQDIDTEADWRLAEMKYMLVRQMKGEAT